ncbi:ACP S-malonyltransferase [Sediminicurvatus halobius]|uniref:Malonyl CoA-acyl carrier protein transacylase n=1 Tax=Sediminicurvatus halobius TaxID=2182432 RepID=A0A2U2N2A8_9GAMM|nr:ACP S-malonyltransferase [Spiribacter halobius]PWG63240.1 [acyl-carrier-protein] S-malonyltransferase [Spiribacter halobius]UEX76689.1 ACP S-malonyltransferase [Spiribacter halobius]
MTRRDDLAFLFPGQGSQSVGMLDALAERHASVQKTFIEASAALDEDLWRLTQEGPQEQLNRTDTTQPVMLTAGVAVWRAWQAGGGPQPARLAGHSLGEYTALVCAGSLDFADAVRLVRDRGRFMQDAVPEGQGAIAAVLGLDDERIGEVCAEAAGDEVVEPVNYNAPGQVVIAGHVGAVERALEAARAAGAKRAVKLPMSVPAHCSLMRPAAERLATRLAEVDIREPQIPVLHNVDVSEAGTPDEIRERLVAQVRSPVLWTGIIRALAAAGIQQAVECGPGKVLAGLNRRIERGMGIAAVYDPDTLARTLETLESA